MNSSKLTLVAVAYVQVAGLCSFGRVSLQALFNGLVSSIVICSVMHDPPLCHYYNDS